MSELVVGPYPVFTDVDGNPLEDGYIFIGVVGADPEISPLQAYWDEDLTSPANNIRTKGGYPLNGTVPGRLYAASEYSIKVKNKRDITVYSTEDSYVSKADSLIAGETPFEALSLSSGRTAFQELTSAALSTSGWYTVAFLLDSGNQSGAADFTITSPSNRATMKFAAQFGDSSSAKTTGNTVMKYLGINDAVNFALKARVAKSDSVIGSGCKIQVYAKSTYSVMQVLKSDNSGRAAGFQLVTPYLDDTPTLPDGITPATFIEAGAELSFDSKTAARSSNRLSALASSADQIRCNVVWDEIPKQGTGITPTPTSVNFRDLDNNSQSTADISLATVADITFDGKEVSFNLNYTGIATGLNTFQPLFFYITTGSFKLTITG